MVRHFLKKSYSAIRLFVVFGGVFLVVVSIINMSQVSPDWEGVPVTPLSTRLLTGIPWLLIGIISLLPHRWTTKKPKFYSIKMGLMLIGSIFILIMVGRGVQSFFIHSKHYIFWLLLIVAGLFAVCAPLSLWINKQLAAEDELEIKKVQNLTE